MSLALRAAPDVLVGWLAGPFIFRIGVNRTRNRSETLLNVGLNRSFENGI